MRRTLDGRILEVRQWQQRTGAAEAQVSAHVAQALEQAAALADADRRAAQLRDELAQAQRRIGQLCDDLAEAHADLRRITGSRSWKITQPLRRVSALLGRRRGLGNGKDRS